VTGVRKAFYGVLVAGELVTLMRVNLKNAEDNLHNVQVLTAQGLVAEYDQLRAQVSVDNLRPEVIRAENGYILALDNLKIAMGIPYERDLDVQGSLEFTPVDSVILEQAPSTVLSINPQLSALRHQAEVNDALISIEWSNHLPSLAAFGNYEFQAQKNQFRFASEDFVRSSLVGLSLSLNIFSGLQTDARIEQARLEFRKSQEQVTGLETVLQTSVQSVLSQLQQARQRIEAQQHTVQQAERGYTIASTRFTSGLGTQLEVNDAQRALTQSKVNRIQAVYDYLVASADLDQLLGRLPPYALTGGE
jgi:outer membrane protein TolC